VKASVSRYLLVLVGVVIVAGAVLSFVFRGAGDATAIWSSAVVAVAVQLGAFMLSGSIGKGNLMARMGAGALLRFVALVAYALLVAFAIKLPLTAALVSLAVFFFVSTLVEPLLLKS
jgi:hypothetical protein